MNRHGSTKINRGFIAPFLLPRSVHFLAAIWHNLSPPLTAWSEKLKKDFEDEYWNRIWSWYGNGGLNNVVAYLHGRQDRRRDADAFLARQPPDTHAQFLHSVSTIAVALPIYATPLVARPAFVAVLTVIAVPLVYSIGSCMTFAVFCSLKMASSKVSC